MQEITKTPLFPVDRIVATPGALAALGNEQTGRLPMASGYGHPAKVLPFDLLGRTYCLLPCIALPPRWRTNAVTWSVEVGMNSICTSIALVKN